MISWNIIILILIILILGVVVYLYFNSKGKEGFQTSTTTTKDTTPPVNLDAKVSPELVQNVTNDLANQGVNLNNTDASGFPVESYNYFTYNNQCALFKNQLDEYNAELQRHRNEGNWTHVQAVRSYINIVKQRQLASSCPTN